MDFSSILLYGALGVFGVLVLVIMIPLIFSLMNNDDKKNPVTHKNERPRAVTKNTQSFGEQDRSVSGQFVIPDKNEHHQRRKTNVHDVPRHTREQYLDTTQPKPRNHQKNWQNHWR